MNPFQKIALNEYFEPALGRALRVSLAFVLPIVWGLVTKNMAPVIWVAITAQLLSNTSIRGSYPVKMLILSGAVLACGVAGGLGTIAGHHWALAAGVMFIMAFIGGFVRQSGSHGPGITISVLLIFLLTLDHPGSITAATDMFVWVVGGGILAMLFTLIAWAFVPFSPFRRSVASTWIAMSDWIQLLSKTSLGEQSNGQPIDDLDEKELAFREALNDSMETISRKQALSHAKQNRLSYQLVELRRIVSFTDPAVSALRLAIDNMKSGPAFPERLLVYLLDNMGQAVHRIAISIITNRPEDVYTARLSIQKMKNNQSLLSENLHKTPNHSSGKQLEQSVETIIQLLEEAVALLENISSRSGNMTFFMRNFFTGMTIPQKLPLVRFEFNFKSFSFRYSLRLALAMGIGIAVYKIFHIPHGYWIAMTTMIILQPEFGATFKKALQRLKGTILGAILGSVLFLFPLPIEVSLSIVFLCSFLMTYNVRRNYGVAAFFITIMVIALYHLLEPVTWQLGLIRISNTIGGAALALIGGFAFFPLWERYRIPALLVKAIQANKIYLNLLLNAAHEKKLQTNMNFVKPRRASEIANSNAFHSLQRMGSEPGQKRKNRQPYYIIIGYNIRLTRLIKTLNQDLVSRQENFDALAIEAFNEVIQKTLEIKNFLTTSPEERPVGSSAEGVISEVNKILKTLHVNGSKTDQKSLIELLDKIAREAAGLQYVLIKERHLLK